MATPKSTPIIISEKQQEILYKITRQGTADYREVVASLILEIGNGSPITRLPNYELQYSKSCHWRLKWLENQVLLNQIEADIEKKKELEKSIRHVLKDKARPGAPSTYSSEEYCQILAIALEPPEESGRPISQWSSQDLADECKKRKPPLEFRPVKSAVF